MEFPACRLVQVQCAIGLAADTMITAKQFSHYGIGFKDSAARVKNYDTKAQRFESLREDVSSDLCPLESIADLEGTAYVGRYSAQNVDVVVTERTSLASTLKAQCYYLGVRLQKPNWHTVWVVGRNKELIENRRAPPIWDLKRAFRHGTTDGNVQSTLDPAIVECPVASVVIQCAWVEAIILVTKDGAS